MKTTIVIIVFIFNFTIAFSQWQTVNTGSGAALNGICFANSSSGWAVGVGGYIFSSTNGGSSWTSMTYGTTGYTGVSFPNQNLGIAVGENARIARYVSNIWGSITISPFTGNINAVQMVNSSTGYCACNSDVILKTTNGGLNWTVIYTTALEGSDDLYALSFINTTTGYVCGIDRRIKKTTDGSTFVSVGTGTSGSEILHGICFKDASTGIVVGEGGLMFRTQNGGTNWTQISTGYTNDFLSIHGASTGIMGYIYFVVGTNGLILRSSNGGANWTQQTCPPPSVTLKSVFCLSKDSVYSSGAVQRIIRTINSGLVSIGKLNENIPENFALYQNYPNPFNPTTKIRFSIPARNNSPMADVKLIVFDILGREVATLVNNRLSPGTYEAELNGGELSSGIYYYRLTTSGYSDTKKMILLK